MTLAEFIDVRVDTITEKLDNDEFESQQDAIEAFYDDVEDFVMKNYHRAAVVFVEYDPDYDRIEEIGHTILTGIKGHGLIDFMVADLFGVDIYVMVITQE